MATANNRINRIVQRVKYWEYLAIGGDLDLVDEFVKGPIDRREIQSYGEQSGANRVATIRGLK